MEKHCEVEKKFREMEFGAKLDKAASTRMRGYEDMIIEKNDEVFYQTQNEKAWLGPAKVMDFDKNWVWITGNSDLKRVPKCKVKLSMKKGSVNFEKTSEEIEGRCRGKKKD